MKIVQIVPAVGWAYQVVEPSRDRSVTTHFPLVAFALVEDEGERWVVGIGTDYEEPADRVSLWNCIPRVDLDSCEPEEGTPSPNFCRGHVMTLHAAAEGDR